MITSSANIKEITERLTACGIKPSLQRLAIIGYLMDHPTHPSADEIHTALVPSIPTLSRTTVYNTLWLMADHGVIDALGVDRTNVRFDYPRTRHAHFVCRRCGAIVDTLIEPTPVATALPEGTEIDNIAVTFHGLCHKCATARREEQNNPV
jgi:Fur family ferric uptake transcriptional regulator/Fur family peroxide stress response transcriptional regulator